MSSASERVIELDHMQDVLRKTFTCFLCKELFDPWEGIHFSSPAYGDPDMAHSMDLCGYCQWIAQ